MLDERDGHELSLPPWQIAAIDQAQAAQKEMLARCMTAETATPCRSTDKLSRTALTLALFAAVDRRAVECCSHIDEDYAGHVVVDLTRGWAYCGCRERRRVGLPGDSRCDLCAQDSATFVEAALAPVKGITFFGCFCARCEPWISSTPAPTRVDRRLAPVSSAPVAAPSQLNRQQRRRLARARRRR